MHSVTGTLVELLLRLIGVGCVFAAASWWVAGRVADSSRALWMASLALLAAVVALYASEHGVIATLLAIAWLGHMLLRHVRPPDRHRRLVLGGALAVGVVCLAGAPLIGESLHAAHRRRFEAELALVPPAATPVLRALEDFRREHGRAAQSLDELTDGGLLSPEALNLANGWRFELEDYGDDDPMLYVTVPWGLLHARFVHVPLDGRRTPAFETYRHGDWRIDVD